MKIRKIPLTCRRSLQCITVTTSIDLASTFSQVAVSSRSKTYIWHVTPIGGIMYGLVAWPGEVGYLLVVISGFAESFAEH